MDTSFTRRFLIDGVIAPFSTLIVCAWMLTRVAPGVDLDAMARGRFTAGDWPRFMLSAVMVCCVLQFLRRLWQWTHERKLPRALYSAGIEVGTIEERRVVEAAPLAMPAGEENPKIAAAATAIVIAYGLAFEWTGFAISTAAFFVAWLLLGGLGRRWHVVLLVTLLGTLLNVYLFVKLAGMPLERGRGIFDAATVAIYRFLHIY